MSLLNKVLQGDVLAAAKLIRGLEDDLPGAVAELKDLYLHTGKAHIVGVSGAPGAGKSTLLGCLIGAFRKRNFKLGVVAVDPTSPLSGGAILGDRLRMQKHGEDKDVFIRSLASRGWKGGLSRATVNTVHVLDAMGKNVIFVEAVGSGQGETDFARLADTSVVVMVPGMGDDIQTIKAGIMEVADIFVINKADREGAESLKMSLETMLEMNPCGREDWKPEILLTTATEDKGIEELTEVLLRHQLFLAHSGEIEKRRRRRAELELTMAVEDALRRHLATVDGCYLEKLVDELAARKTDPNTAARKVIKLPPTSPFRKGR
ncbi:MAG: methylmalonyl Co-A mutase-associated GTPase MeaB [Dehalococcoidales bacterium]|nr:methylmalonyl Co-A mutase-associated GTPase MeaB [Dehalococcoidales bacterium]